MKRKKNKVEKVRRVKAQVTKIRYYEKSVVRLVVLLLTSRLNQLSCYILGGWSRYD